MQIKSIDSSVCLTLTRYISIVAMQTSSNSVVLVNRLKAIMRSLEREQKFGE